MNGEEGIPRGLKRALKNDDCGLQEEGPGLKPLVFAEFFAGLKPCAPSEKAKALRGCWKKVGFGAERFPQIG